MKHRDFNFRAQPEVARPGFGLMPVAVRSREVRLGGVVGSAKRARS